jgi:hypothetical protein
MARYPFLVRPALHLTLGAMVLSSVPSNAETVGYWRFEEQTSGNVSATNTGGAVPNTVLDSSGKGNHMQTWTATTAPTYITSVPFSNATVAGIPATGATNTASLDFRGSPVDIYSGSNSSSKPINSKTFSAWTVEASFCVDVAGRWQVIVGKDGNPVNGQPPLSLKVRADNTVEIGIVDGSGVGRWCVGSTKIEANKWYQVAATATASELSLWIKPEGCRDYIAQGSVPIQGAFFNTYSAFNQPWIIGRGMWKGVMTDATDGKIDEVRVSDTALTPAQFLGNFAAADSDADELPDAWELVYFRANATETDAEILAKQSSLTADPDGDGYANRVELRSGTNPAVADNLTGELTRQVWLKLPGANVTDLTNNPRFYGKADITTLNDGISTSRDFADNFGERLQGWVTAPVTGDYTFWVAGDNQCELWLSTNQSKFNKQLIASVPVWSAPDEWDKFPAQKSVVVHLVAGQKYFIECLHKEAAIYDSLSVAWQVPGETRQLIPAQQFTPYLEDSEDQDLDGLVDAWEQNVGLSTDFFSGAEGDNGANADPDDDGFNNLLEAQTSGDPFSGGGNAGYVSRDIWTGLPGGKLKDLTASAAFPKPANDSSLVSSALNFGSYGDNYGQRIQGLIVPPKSGNWRFWLASDDAGEFQLSTSASSVDKCRAAYVENWVAVGNYDASATQKSESKTLVAGTPYYFEILHKENTLVDHASLAWAYEPVNWALTSNGATATQSSTYATSCPASMAIDGNPDGSTFTHTNSVSNSWWQVNFGQNRVINRVVLFNRKDLQTRLSNFRISVRDEQDAEVAGQNFYEGTGNAGNSMTWDLPASVMAAKIRISLLGNNNQGNGILTLAEVQAFEWVPEAERQVVASQFLRTAGEDPLDADGDSLPDAWETAKGLNPADNGSVNFVNGEYSDSDHDLMSNREEYLLGLNPLQADPAPGRFLTEIWNNVSAYSVNDLIASSRIYGAADSVELRKPSECKFPGQYFGTRSRGYITPAVSGDYTFWISSRTSAELWLSSDSVKGKYAKQRIAAIDSMLGGGHGIGAYESNLWDRFSSQRSVAIHLEAGQTYYLEILHQHGHTADAHSSVAWALGNGARVELPTTVVSSYIKTADDADDDYLPDAWENQYGLDSSDNGSSDPVRQGERGDYDDDGLSNREEYLLGTNPASADTDEDGVSDFIEVKTYGTSPLQYTDLGGTVVDTPVLTEYNPSGTSGSWQLLDDGLMGDSFRGRIEWNFTVPSDGWWLIELTSRLRGNLRPTENLVLGIKIDGKSLADETLRFLNGEPSSLNIVTPWLQEGTHTFSLEIRNDMGRRKLQIQSIDVLQPDGVDANNNGLPDWLDDHLALGNKLAPLFSESPVSPLFIEGNVRYTGGVQVSAAGQQVAAVRGLGDLHWFANVPLNETGGTPLTVSFEDRQYPVTITWSRWNAMAGQGLTVRVGDSVKIGGWLSAGDNGNVQITLAGQTQTLPASDAFVKTFTQAGNFPVTALHSNGTQASATISVVGADFGSPQPFYADVVTWRSFPQVPASLKITSEPSIVVDSTAAEGTGQKAFLRPLRSGLHTLGARIGSESGPIVSLGTVTTIGVSDALKGDAAGYLGSMPDGYLVLRTPITVTDLPPGGRVVLTIFRAGVTFLDGTTVMTLQAEDFVDGVAYVDFRYPPGMAGGYCHYIDVYDAQGRNLGRR